MIIKKLENAENNEIVSVWFHSYTANSYSDSLIKLKNNIFVAG